MSRAAAVRVAAVVAIGALISVVVRALRGEPAPVFSLPPLERGMLAPGATPSTDTPAARVDPQAGEPPSASDPSPEPEPELSSVPAADVPSEPADGVPRPPGERWAFPVDGECPPGHPIKAKLRSGIYHLPGMMAYDRARPDRCYASEVDACADGLRRAKR